MGTTVMVALGGLVVLVIFLMAIARVLRFIQKVPPNMALLVYGVRCRTKIEEKIVNFRIVKGGMTIVLPVVHQTKPLDLSLMTLEVKVESVLSSQAVPITVDGIAQIKIGSDDIFIATAAEQLLDKKAGDIENIAVQTLQGHLRAIVGLLTVEQVYKDRETFAREVLKVAVDDLAGMGLQIVSFTIREISDSVGYLTALGQQEIQSKLRDARIAKAQTDQEATEREQLAAKNKAAYIKDTEVARANFSADVARQQAIAERAKDISLAEQNKTLEERKAEAAKQAAERRNQELEAEVRRPADANLYKARQEAEAVLATGKAEAGVRQVTGEAEAAANKAKGIAGADVIAATGEAEGKAIEARLLAEAKGKRELAESLNAYEPGALRLVLGQALLEGIPAVAESFGNAFGNIDQIRLIEIGGGAGAPGEEVKGAVERFLEMLPNTLFKFLQGATALLATPIDDLVATWVAEEAAKRGIKVTPEAEQVIKERVTEKLAEVAAMTETPSAATPVEPAPTVEVP